VNKITKKSAPSISLILPVFNEKGLIEEAVRNCNDVLSQTFEDFEIILVDDGSTDGTGEIMEGLAANNKQIHVLHNNVNLSVGISILRAFAISTKEYMVHNAADLPLNPKDIAQIVKTFGEDCDIIVLERKIYKGATLLRRVASKINRLLLHTVFPIVSRGVSDMNFTQIYRREIFKDILPLARSPEFTTPEMILRALYKGLRVKSVLVDYWPRRVGKSAFCKPHDILWSLYDMFRFRLKCWKGI
jgi:dolichol-phosphate mannosyltransferase